MGVNVNRNEQYNNHSVEYRGPNVGNRVPFHRLQDAGAYVCNWSGHLLRIPDEGFAQGGSPFFNIVSCEPLYLTKLSSDPFIAISSARLLASNFDVPVNF